MTAVWVRTTAASGTIQSEVTTVQLYVGVTRSRTGPRSNSPTSTTCRDHFDRAASELPSSSPTTTPSCCDRSERTRARWRRHRPRPHRRFGLLGNALAADRRRASDRVRVRDANRGKCSHSESSAGPRACQLDLGPRVKSLFSSPLSSAFSSRSAGNGGGSCEIFSTGHS
jgi:hypothetical protein